MTTTDQQPTCKTYSNGSKAWYLNRKYHRVDGPAVEYNGYKEWHLNGKRYYIGNLNKWPIQLYLNYLRWNRLEI